MSSAQEEMTGDVVAELAFLVVIPVVLTVTILVAVGVFDVGVRVLVVLITVKVIFFDFGLFLS